MPLLDATSMTNSTSICARLIDADDLTLITRSPLPLVWHLPDVFRQHFIRKDQPLPFHLFLFHPGVIADVFPIYIHRMMMRYPQSDGPPDPDMPAINNFCSVSLAGRHHACELDGLDSFRRWVRLAQGIWTRIVRRSEQEQQANDEEFNFPNVHNTSYRREASNAWHQRHATKLGDDGVADLRVRCMPLLDCGPSNRTLPFAILSDDRVSIPFPARCRDMLTELPTIKRNS